METEKLSGILVENFIVQSFALQRQVIVDFYYPAFIDDEAVLNLLLINDGQDLMKMDFTSILEQQMISEKSISPLICVGIHCAADRKMEYGVAGVPDFKGRGAKAGLYTLFILEELMPYIQAKFPFNFKAKAFAGFSLGGLMAMDIVWKHPQVFTFSGVFSGSLWWREIDQTERNYDDDKHRIMQQQVRVGDFYPGLKFFFQCGNMDETKDRNHNGIIDSVDDTLDLINELFNKGYDPDRDIFYLELPQGRHDVPTWGKSMPVFLKWAFPLAHPSQLFL